jgi:hypothetical protein
MKKIVSDKKKGVYNMKTITKWTWEEFFDLVHKCAKGRRIILLPAALLHSGRQETLKKR